MRNQSGNILLPRLAALRRRLSFQVFVEQFARSALVSMAVAVLLAALERWGHIRISWLVVSGALAAGTLLWSALSVALWVPSVERLAQLLDHLGATRDRWTTALSFSESDDATHAPALRECTAYLTGRDFRKLLPWTWPRSFAWLAVPGLALGLLQWDLHSARVAKRERRTEAQEEIAGTVQQLKKLAQQIEQANPEKKNGELERIAEELKRSAEQLRTGATERDAAAKSALRELSSLEQLVKEMQQQQPAQLSPEEMEALAKALEQQEETKQAAQALQQGNAEEAAKALEQAAQQLAEKKDEAAAQQAEKTLREALQRLAQQRQSEALRQAARQALQRSGNGGAEQLLQQLAQMLKNSPQQAGGQKAGGNQNAKQNLQNILAALQNMKHGQKQGDPSGENQKGEGGEGEVLIQSFAQSAEGQPQPGDAQLPSGRPGTEHDQGTTESPFGPDRSAAADKGGELSLRGQLGEGESLSQLLPTSGGDDKARRRYKELYDAVLPAAEEAVLQENIPLGSRYFIRRYFESIRPEE